MPEYLKPLPRHNAPSTQPRGDSRIVLWSLLAVFSLWPRLWIIGFWIFGRQLGDAFDTWILPALGFLILPWTTLLYAWMWAISSDGVTGWEWSLVGIAFLIDVGFWVAARRAFR